ncbi:hypothetical protein B0H10DRAFT_1982325 [Mycena sp. CBHHK59/15]|nr:hypothetical protein B0H10DRAFT_1982325 [Mycena sp. CBHHK59/15]
MVSSPVFLRIRAIAFSLIMAISFLWIILLCLYMYIQWDVTDSSERPTIAVMLLTNTLTLIILLILLILPFRPWLDAARFLFLILAHIGVAATFAFWNPRFHCPTSTADAEGVCRLLNLYILIASWIIPVLLIAYASGLALAMARSSPQNKLPPMERESILPMMRPALDSDARVLSLTYPTLECGSKSEELRKHISDLSFGSRPSKTYSASAPGIKHPPACFV